MNPHAPFTGLLPYGDAEFEGRSIRVPADSLLRPLEVPRDTARVMKADRQRRTVEHRCADYYITI